MTQRRRDPRAAPIESKAEAENLVRHLLAAMDALVATVEQETELVRAGKLKQAATLEPTKTDLARAYVADTAQVKANLPALTEAGAGSARRAAQAARHLQRAAADQSHGAGHRACGVGRHHPRRACGSGAQERAADLRQSGRATAAPPRSAATPLSVSRSL